MHTIELTYQTATGHRIPTHQGGRGEEARLHGHTFGYFVQLSAETLDDVGLVADFGAIKAVLDRWDHRTLLWDDDPIRLDLAPVAEDLKTHIDPDVIYHLVENEHGITRVPFVPTSEMMAQHLAETFVGEFEVVFALVEVRESPLTAARYYCNKADMLRRQDG